MSKNAKYGIALLAVLGIFFVIMNYLQFEMKAEEINCTPKQYYNVKPSNLPPELLNRKFRFALEFVNFKEEDYQKFFPKTIFPGQKNTELYFENRQMGGGDVHVTVFFDYPPDSKYLQERVNK